tara:strand:- start:740 stop:1561 length:822 start_codon:yes stop_codon:yes gene_type:complete
MKKYLDYCDNCNSMKNKNILTEHKENNIVVYGNNIINNYGFSLLKLKNVSKSNLKYSRRIAINYNGEDILFNISDVHFEVDFDLLGVNQYNIFITLFHHIQENLISDKQIFYVLCLNFQEIKLELMNIFYSFMGETKIRFIILTTQISFICEKILQSSLIKKVKGEILYKSIGQQENIDKLTKMIIQNNVSLFSLREQLYSFLTLNYKIHDCFAKVVFKLIEIQYINDQNINLVLKTYNEFTEKYNNNYRPIYHLESFILFLINLKNKQEKES